MKRGDAASGSSRLLAVVLLLLLVSSVAALLHVGTRWAVPSSLANTARYLLLSYWGGDGASGGKLFHPIGIAVSPGGDVFVTDARNRVVRLSSSGEFKREWGSEGNGPGQFSNPRGSKSIRAGGLRLLSSSIRRAASSTARCRSGSPGMSSG